MLKRKMRRKRGHFSLVTDQLEEQIHLEELYKTMKKNDPKKDPDPPPSQEPQAPVKNGLRRGSTSGSQVIPDLQSTVSGMSGSSSMNSSIMTSGGDNPLEASAGAGRRVHRHHAHLPLIHPNFEGLDVFKNRHKKPIRQLAGARVHAPKVLVVTMESALEDKVEAHGYDLRRRLADSQTEDMGLNVLTTQIHDMEDMEWMLDEESQLLLRKHIIYWKSALSMPRRKMRVKDTTIPSTATVDYCKPLTRCQRYNRTCARACCARYRMTITEDLVRGESIWRLNKDLFNSTSSGEAEVNDDDDNAEKEEEDRGPNQLTRRDNNASDPRARTPISPNAQGQPDRK